VTDEVSPATLRWARERQEAQDAEQLAEHQREQALGQLTAEFLEIADGRVLTPVRARRLAAAAWGMGWRPPAV
jgi:hypothetical protein